MVESDPSPDAATNAVFSRRSHRKSRNGCKICKKRHLKCDEAKPECSNCLNHSVQCVYASPVSSSQKADAATQRRAKSTSSVKTSFKLQFVDSEYQHVWSMPPTNPNRMQEKKTPVIPLSSPPGMDSQFCLEDFELQHYFLSSTCFTLIEDEASHNFWSSVVPRMGYRFPLVHHLMLSLACLHMLRSEERRQGNCVSRFDYHYGLGLRLMSACLPEVIANNSEAIWIGSILICLVAMARGPSEGNYLFFGREGPVEWVSLLQGVNVISNIIQKQRIPNDHEQNPLRIPFREHCAYRGSICRLKRFTQERAASDPLLQTYLLAIDSVLQAFDSAFYDDTPDQHGLPPAKPEPFGFVLFTWVTRMERGFWDALQRKEAVSLVILAYFVVVIHRMSKSWLSHGWPEHILQGIWTFLEEKDRGLIQWPLDQIQLCNT
ncbi:hypothetical protein BDV30DRAFT_223783 [Aspergillus minisclerotigenes]|uniref:Zn(2)-C6 fungal-type domain-containing protein n=1 Tax=Aspergillus minisclerotigenes TaxID=656917 RepID=A0A5N6JEV6_9EURO|nr:hypothetical protein BDV30DRAFT_223783 [Aspergillus minisclerotigenes]